VSERVRLIERGIVLQDFSGIVDHAEGLAAIAAARAFMAATSASAVRAARRWRI